MFSLEILSDDVVTSGLDSMGRITIGEMSERIGVCFVSGGRNATEQSWATELQKLVDGAKAVAVRTQPNFAWLFYREDEAVFVQEQLIVEGWGGALDDHGHIVSLPDRETFTEDGDRISEWSTTVDAVSAFLSR